MRNMVLAGLWKRARTCQAGVTFEGLYPASGNSWADNSHAGAAMCSLCPGEKSWVQKRCLGAHLGCIVASWSLTCCGPLTSSQLMLLRYLDADAQSEAICPARGLS